VTITVSKAVDMILCANLRPCEKCKAATWWARRGQRKLGLCLDCAPRGAEAPHEALVDAVLSLLEVFEHGEMHEQGPPPLVDAATFDPWTRATIIVRWALGSHPVRLLTAWVHDPDAGPCSLCTRPIVRYGPLGRPLCRACHEITR
jgi:hypothetical protein